MVFLSRGLYGDKGSFVKDGEVQRQRSRSYAKECKKTNSGKKDDPRRRERKKGEVH